MIINRVNHTTCRIQSVIDAALVVSLDSSELKAAPPENKIYLTPSRIKEKYYLLEGLRPREYRVLHGTKLLDDNSGPGN